MLRLAYGVIGALLVLIVGSAQASAQCMKCSSSSSCGASSLRGGCSVSCTGTTCACLDQTCKPKPTRHFEPVGTNGDVNIVALRADAMTRLVSICHDRWIGIAFAPTRVRAVRNALTVVSFRPSQGHFASVWLASDHPRIRVALGTSTFDGLSPVATGQHEVTRP